MNEYTLAYTVQEYRFLKVNYLYCINEERPVGIIR